MATAPVILTEVDPWLDQYTYLGGSDSSYFEELPQIAKEQQLGVPDPAAPDFVPDLPVTPKASEEPVVPVAAAPVEPILPPAPIEVAEPEVEAPRVTTFEDGSSLTVEKSRKGWKAVLDTNIAGVNPETFYGNTKDELYTRIAAGKVNATKKIRELNRKSKLGDTLPATSVKRTAPQTATLRDLTPDEIFEYKTLHESNPQAALDYFNEKRYGLKPAAFVQKLNEGTTARQLGDIESVARTFVSTNKDYYPSGNNFLTLVKYLVRTHQGRAIAADENLDQLTTDLLETGVWTVENLEAAKEDLLSSELLDVVPAPRVVPEPAPQPVVAVQPQPVQVTPVPQVTPQPVVQPVLAPVPEARIAPQPTVRLRPGNLGIRVGETVNQPVTAETPVIDEDMSNWTDNAVELAMADFRRRRAQAR